MKKKSLVIVLVLVLAFVAVSFSPLVMEPAAQDEEPETTVELTVTESAGVVAEAKLWPKEDASLGFATNGIISLISNKAGDKVTKGDVLAELKGTEEYKLQISEAEVEKAEAEDELKALNDAQPGDKAAAELRLINAKRALDEMNEAFEEFDTKAYRDKIDDAYQKVRDHDDELEDAQDLVDDMADLPENSDLRIKTDDDYKTVKYDHDELQRAYDLLVNDRDQAWADVLDAQAEVDNAQLEVDELADGPKPSKLDIVNKKISAADQKISAANDKIEQMQIIAPFDGEIAKIDVVEGELVTANNPIIVMLDSSELILKTVDLEETDMVNVREGQRVSVTFDAYPNNEINGTVTKITNWSEIYLGDVVYPVEVTLDSNNLSLMWGMTASVYF